jgi:hypothetical protein
MNFLYLKTEKFFFFVAETRFFHIKISRIFFISENHFFFFWWISDIIKSIFWYKKKTIHDKLILFISYFFSWHHLRKYKCREFFCISENRWEKNLYYIFIIKYLWGTSWSWSYGSWNYKYICNQLISPLTLWVRTHLMARFTRYNFMW